MSKFRRDILLLIAMVGIVAVALVVGQAATFPNLVPWYAGLRKPGFNPPNWVFGPVWTSLYVLMAIASWRILRLRPGTPGRGAALTAYGVQLALNVAWSWMFFAAHSPLLGLINIVPQWLVIVAAIRLAWAVDRTAAWCLVPLAVWVGYATALNVALWQLNG